MIDFIRARFDDKGKVEAYILGEESLNPEGKYHFNTAEIVYPTRTKIRNMQINITESSSYIQNSLHKYFNYKYCHEKERFVTHNYNDFKFEDLKWVIGNLEKRVDYDLGETVLTKLEFGLNIRLSIDPTDFVKRNLLFHKLQSPCYNPKNRNDMSMKQFVYTNYVVKVYNKSLHFKLNPPNDNILRVEIKYKSKREFNKFGVTTIKDLLVRENLQRLFNDLLSKFDELLIIDSYDGNSNMSKKDRQELIKFTNPSYWIDLSDNSHPNIKSRKKKALNGLIEACNLNSWKQIVRGLLVLKFNELMIPNQYDTLGIVINSDNILGEKLTPQLELVEV